MKYLLIGFLFGIESEHRIEQERQRLEQSGAIRLKRKSRAPREELPIEKIIKPTDPDSPCKYL